MDTMPVCTYIVLLSVIALMFAAHSVWCQAEEPSMEEVKPSCVGNSVCGLVQLNMRGISGTELCRCNKYSHCPLDWDPFDSRTIQHAADQYKYCERAPTLKSCYPGQVVHSVTMELNVPKDRDMVYNMKMHCICPSNHIIAWNGTQTHHLPNGIAIDVSKFQCKMPEVCGSSDACMTITHNDRSTMVYRRCSCPIDTYCPYDIRYAAEKIGIGKNSFVFKMQCMG